VLSILHFLVALIIMQWESDNRTSLVIKPLIITGLPKAIRYLDLDIGPYRVAVFSGYQNFPDIGRPVIGLLL
jgi:hypothetical protein